MLNVGFFQRQTTTAYVLKILFRQECLDFLNIRRPCNRMNMDTLSRKKLVYG